LNAGKPYYYVLKRGNKTVTSPVDESAYIKFFLGITNLPYECNITVRMKVTRMVDNKPKDEIVDSIIVNVNRNSP